jgi:hypothetical protein
MTYAGETPLVGGKLLNFKTFYGGIGANIQEMFSVNELEQDQTAFFVSTTPNQPAYNIRPEDLPGILKKAGRNTDAVEALMTDKNGIYNPAHLVGLETKQSFNGTWGTDATWHRIFYKDVKAHEMFTGVFEAEKLIKFHENPVPERISAQDKAICNGDIHSGKELLDVRSPKQRQCTFKAMKLYKMEKCFPNGMTPDRKVERS